MWYSLIKRVWNISHNYCIVWALQITPQSILFRMSSMVSINLMIRVSMPPTLNYDQYIKSYACKHTAYRPLEPLKDFYNSEPTNRTPIYATVSRCDRYGFGSTRHTQSHSRTTSTTACLSDVMIRKHIFIKSDSCVVLADSNMSWRGNDKNNILPFMFGILTFRMLRDRRCQTWETWWDARWCVRCTYVVNCGSTAWKTTPWRHIFSMLFVCLCMCVWGRLLIRNKKHRHKNIHTHSHTQLNVPKNHSIHVFNIVILWLHVSKTCADWMHTFIFHSHNHHHPL